MKGSRFEAVSPIQHAAVKEAFGSVCGLCRRCVESVGDRIE
jgi:hypothetical protein